MGDAIGRYNAAQTCCPNNEQPSLQDGFCLQQLCLLQRTLESSPSLLAGRRSISMMCLVN